MLLLCRSPALSVSYSPDASLIAVGLAGGGVSVVKPSEEDVTTLQLEKVAGLKFVREADGISSEESITFIRILRVFFRDNRGNHRSDINVHIWSYFRKCFFVS